MSKYPRNCGTCKHFDALEGYRLGLCTHPDEYGEESDMKIILETEKCFNYELEGVNDG